MGIGCRQKIQNTNGKRGFTLAEICVALALVAVLGVMITSFSTLTSNVIKQNQNDYRFLEQCDQVRQTLTKWIAFCDDGSTLEIVKGGNLASESVHIAFSGEELTLTRRDTAKLTGLTEISTITFEIHETKLIKCTVQSTNEKMKPQVFLFSLRNSNIAIVPTEPTTRPENGEGK